MMLLDRYLIRQFSRNLALVLGSLLAIYLLVDFFERVDNFLSAGLGMGAAIKYLLLKIPFMFEQLIPVCLLLAGIITLGLLNQHYEFMALKASGLNLKRIIRPLLVAAAFFTLLALAFSQWLLPPTMAETNRIWHEEVNQLKARGIERQGRIYYRGAEGIYSFARPQEGSETLHDFSYAVWNEAFRLQKLLTAERAEWGGDRAWTLFNGQSKEADDQGYRLTLFKELPLELPETPADLFLPPYAYTEKSLDSLLAESLDRADTPLRHTARLELHKKLSYLGLGVPLLLLGIPLLLLMHRGRGRDLALAIPASCILAFVAWGGWSVSQSLAAAAYLPPSVASWLIHFLVGALGWYGLKQQDQ